VQLKQAYMNKTPPPVPKSYHKHKLERASLVDSEMERSTEIPKSISNNSLPNICISSTTPVTNEPPVANLLSLSPPPTPPPRRRKQRGSQQATSKSSTLDITDGRTILDDQSSSDDVDSSSTSSSSSSNSPTATTVAPPLPPRNELTDYVTMLQPKTMDLPLPAGVPPPLPPRDELTSPVLMYNSSSAPPLPPRDVPPPLLPSNVDAIVPIAPPRDKKRSSPKVNRKSMLTYTPPLPHKELDLGRRCSVDLMHSSSSSNVPLLDVGSHCDTVDMLHDSPSPDISLLDVGNQWPDEFSNTIARELLAQESRTSFTEEIAKKLQSNLFMRPSKAVMDTLADDPFSSLPPPLIPSTSSSPQVERKTDVPPSTTASNDPLDRLFDKSDLNKWVTTSSSQQMQHQEKHTTANGNVLT